MVEKYRFQVSFYARTVNDENSPRARSRIETSTGKIHSRQSDSSKETQLLVLNEPINAGPRYRSALFHPAKWSDCACTYTYICNTHIYI